MKSDSNKDKKVENYKSPADLAEKISKGYWRTAKHLEYIDKHLVMLEQREITKLMVNLPPRHGKSELISYYFPLWYLLKHPTHNIILTAYNAGFAQSWGRRVKQIIESEFANSDIQIAKDMRSIRDFKIIEYEGGMSCVGIGGSLTGKGANLLIIDDPVKNSLEANSHRQRENQWDWYRSTAFTRLEPKGIVVLVMTRWNQDDLAGRILQNEIEEDDEFIYDEIDTKWEKIKIPAIAEDEDLLGRAEGEPLWNERFPIKKLEYIKRTLGSYTFGALYQQRPAPLSGNMFKRVFFRYFRESGENYIIEETGEQNIFEMIPKANCKLYQTVDLAVSTKEKSDYTVIMTVAVTPKNHILVVDIHREKIEGSGHLNLIKSLYHKFKPISIGIETVAYQMKLFQDAISIGIPAIALKPNGSKEFRTLPIAAKIVSGLVRFNQNASWLADFEDELLNFPHVKHDDQVDCLAYSDIIASNSSEGKVVSRSRNEKYSLY